MSKDLDLERVVNDPDYRRKAIADLKRAEERQPDGTAPPRDCDGADGDAE